MTDLPDCSYRMTICETGRRDLWVFGVLGNALRGKVWMVPLDGSPFESLHTSTLTSTLTAHQTIQQ
jgi:hypothetical protein